jgi:hypothetical protein
VVVVVEEVDAEMKGGVVMGGRGRLMTGLFVGSPSSSYFSSLSTSSLSSL